jgi:hypothetical protein
MGKIKQMMIDQEESRQLALNEDPVLLNNTLEQRSIYGSFRMKAAWIQGAKLAIRETPNWNSLQCAEQEALDNIMQKMGRILFGEYHADNYLDIAGYATLVLRGD